MRRSITLLLSVALAIFCSGCVVVWGVDSDCCQKRVVTMDGQDYLLDTESGTMKKIERKGNTVTIIETDKTDDSD